ncbi:hypothetical protein [Priestia megaterium]|uniref:hypothetical protein n=1 Tax=Priestia megaterium TaxID=1404 RepID=UPI003100BCF1
MEKAIEQLHMLMNNVLADFSHINKKRIGVWVKEGEYLNSKVEISFEDNGIDYELFIYLHKEEQEILTPHEMFIFLHEMSHIVILEKIKNEQGIKAAEMYLNEYKDDIKNLEKKAKKENWNDTKIQKEYENIKCEKQTDSLTKTLFERYVRIASV